MSEVPPLRGTDPPGHGKRGRTSTSPVDATSYYGRPVVKGPVWKTEIPTYFFLGGMAGASAVLALGARLSGNERLARNATLVNSSAITISPILLVKDLGRPERFLNMMRVFKVTSPMSVGTWIVSGSGTAAGAAAYCELAHVMPRTKAAAQAVAGLLGPFLATYTGALVADSVVPAWHDARRELPLVFAAGSAASAGGAAAILTAPAYATPARRLAILGGLGELISTYAMEKRLGDLVGEPYHEGRAGRYAKLSKRAALAGTALMALAGRRRAGAVVAGSLLVAGSFCERFSVYNAGKQSAADPRYTTLPQKERAAERGQPAVTRPS